MTNASAARARCCQDTCITEESLFAVQDGQEPLQLHSAASPGAAAKDPDIEFIPDGKDNNSDPSRTTEEPVPGVKSMQWLRTHGISLLDLQALLPHRSAYALCMCCQAGTGSVWQTEGIRSWMLVSLWMPFGGHPSVSDPILLCVAHDLRLQVLFCRCWHPSEPD